MKKYVIEIGDKEYQAELKELTKDYADIEINGSLYHVKLKQLGRSQLGIPEIKVQEVIPPPKAELKTNTEVSVPTVKKTGTNGGTVGGVRAPMPGLIIDIMVQEGEQIKAGQKVILMEAMKMENVIEAPLDGTINKIYVKKGDSVEEEQLLIEIGRSAITII